MAPVPGAVHFALKRAYFNLVLRLGVEPGSRSLAEIQAVSLARVAFARSLVDGGTGLIAVLDGAVDALKYGQPADIQRAKTLTGRALADLHLLLEAATSDGFTAVGMGSSSPAAPEVPAVSTTPSNTPGDDAVTEG